MTFAEFKLQFRPNYMPGYPEITLVNLNIFQASSPEVLSG